MNKYLPQNLIALAKALDKPLYVTGGFVRNFIIAKTDDKVKEKLIDCDVDICGDIEEEVLINKAKEFGFAVKCVYKKLGTVKFEINGAEIEYTRFREEKYDKGHTPCEINFISDLEKDALRRDFKCNAIYYDLAKDEVIDPLCGVKDIENKILSPVTEKTFKDDGLRVLRFCRFCGALGFLPSREGLLQAKNNIKNLKDIAPERIWGELNLMLVADKFYGNKNGHYEALKIADEIGFFEFYIPELYRGKFIRQREDIHKFNVFEHTLRAVLFSPPSVRLSALFHDIGKTVCFEENGNFYGHENYSKALTEKYLKKLKCSNAEIEKNARLVSLHMKDLSGNMREIKIRRLIAENEDIFQDLLSLKDADASACDGIKRKNSVNEKWLKIYKEMKEKEIPFSNRELKIDGKDLIKRGFCGKAVGKKLKRIFDLCLEGAIENNREKLLAHIDKGKEKGEKD